MGMQVPGGPKGLAVEEIFCATLAKFFRQAAKTFQRIEMNKKLVHVVALFGCLLLPHLLPAQEVASLTGVVTDKTGAVIPQALVKVTDTKTSATFVTVTNGVGSYTFTRLLPGPGYTVEVTKDGFQSVSITNIYLGVDATHTQNVQLQVGKVGEVVEVRGSGSQVTLNTTDASVSTTLPMELVHELPLAVRDNPLALLAYSPGVTVSGGDETWAGRGAWSATHNA